MIDAIALEREQFSGTTRLILDEIERRGWSALTIAEGSSHLYIDRGDGRLVHIFGSTPPQQTYAAGILSNNKPLASLILRDAGIPQLPFISITDDMHPELVAFIDEHSRVVVKPIDGSHGNGIRANITTVEDAVAAIKYARQFSSSKRVLIQRQFNSDRLFDIRILCIGGEFTAAIHRVPARVFGDGIHTTMQLIHIENESVRRGVAYKFPYALIDVARAQKFLGDVESVAVPNPGDEIRVMDVANYGAGGELIDISDVIPEWMKREAELASLACEVHVAGVDYLLSELPTLNTKRNDIESVIIEINKSPALMIHDNPHQGENRYTVSKFIDLVQNYEVV